MSLLILYILYISVFVTFMNSEKILYVFMSALLSGNLEISIGASKIFISLLEYQNNNKITVRHILVFMYLY